MDLNIIIMGGTTYLLDGTPLFWVKNKHTLEEVERDWVHVAREVGLERVWAAVSSTVKCLPANICQFLPCLWRRIRTGCSLFEQVRIESYSRVHLKGDRSPKLWSQVGVEGYLP
jgi:hypothetical protein